MQPAPFAAEVIKEGGPQVCWVAALSMLALLSSLAMASSGAGIGRLERRPRAALWAFVVPVSLCAAATLITLLRVRDGWGWLVKDVTQYRGMFLGPMVEQPGIGGILMPHVAVASLVIISAALCCALLCLAGSAVRAAPAGRRAALGVLLIAAGVATGLLAARAIFLEQLALIHGFANTPGIDSPWPQEDVLLRSIVASHANHLRQRSIFLAAAGLGGAASLAGSILLARAGAVFDRGLVALSLATLALGGWAFSATRGHAWDAAHVVPLSDARIDATRHGPLPIVARCPTGDRQEVLEVRYGIVAFRGRQVDPSEFFDWAATLLSNYRLLHPSEPPPEDAYWIHAPPDTPMRKLLPYLALTRRWPARNRWTLVGSRSETLDSRTLGPFNLVDVCPLEFSINPAAPRLSRFTTWGELAVALAASPIPLAFSLDPPVRDPACISECREARRRHRLPRKVTQAQCEERWCGPLDAWPEAAGR